MISFLQPRVTFGDFQLSGFPGNGDLEVGLGTFQEAGKIDLENGKYRAKGTKLNMKFSEEARFSLGVGMKRVNDDDVGCRLPLFEYTGQNLVTQKDFDAAF